MATGVLRFVTINHRIRDPKEYEEKLRRVLIVINKGFDYSGRYER